jgi:hypothetical protein
MNAPRVSGGAVFRLLVGFAMLPPAAGVLMFVTCLALWGLGLWIFEGTGGWDAALSLGIAIAIVAVPTTIVAAVPAVLWLIRRRQLSLGTLVLVGGLVGNLPFVVILGTIVAVQYARGALASDVGRLWFGWYGAARAIVLGVSFGITLAALLWFVAIRRSEFIAQA